MIISTTNKESKVKKSQEDEEKQLKEAESVEFWNKIKNSNPNSSSNEKAKQSSCPVNAVS
jgi:hypothetical protein